MRILVSGAGGFVGRHLLPFLRADGHDVVALRRGVGGEAGDFAGPADLADIDGFPGWPAGIEAVVHLAALNPARGDRRAGDIEALRRANVSGTAALARRAAREGVRRMVFAGSSIVHAPGRVARESDALAPRTPYGVSKAEAEAAFRNALAGTRTQGVVLRPAPVFGPGARNLTTALARLARTPFPLPLEGFGGARSLLSVDGLVEAIRLALTVDGAGGGTFLLAEDEPMTPAGIVAALRKGTGRRAMLLPAPVRPLRFAAARLGKTPALAAVEGGIVIDAALARERLGWRPKSAAVRLRDMAAAGRL